MKSMRFIAIVSLYLSSIFATTAFANNTALDLVPQAWQMLDYLAVDYAEAVEDGEVIAEGEYTEMVDFSSTVHNYILALPETAQKAQLEVDATQLQRLVNNKAAHALVKKQAQRLADDLIEAYPIPTAPDAAPDLSLGAVLYQEHCASCHGVTGNGDGQLAEGLDPEPIAFTDKERANQRSALSLYQTITQGVDGTSMAAYRELSENERWALAFYVGTLAYTDQVAAGASLWENNELARAQVSTLKELSHLRADQLDSVLGEAEAEQLVGYLRTYPAELEEAATGLALARGRLQASLNAYQNEDYKGAVALALSSYLDGVEPVEPALNAKNNKLRQQIELQMGVYRTGLSRSLPVAELAPQVATIDALLVEAQATIGNSYDASTVFMGAFTILLREGLEALLVVIGILTFLSRSGRREAIAYVHAGWVIALVAGGLTWLAARYFIEISGASRELTEGISALFAAVMLLGIGLWMHQKSIGDRWQAYIADKVNQALNKKSIWFLFILSFISVYREVFETILFYAALWTDGLGHWLIAGMLAAIAVLAALAWGLLKTSRALPISTFFSASSALIAVLAVVLTGKGVSALQEAGWVHVTLAPTPTIDLLGMYSTWETVVAQLIMLSVLVIGYFYNKRSA